MCFLVEKNDIIIPTHTMLKTFGLIESRAEGGGGRSWSLPANGAN